MSTLVKILTGISKRHPQSALSRLKGIGGKRLRLKSRRRRLYDAAAGWSANLVPQIPAAAATASADFAERPKKVDYTAERAAFAQLKDELIGKYPGKFVVFIGSEMIGPFESLPSAVGAAYKRYGRRPIYTKELIPDDSSR